MEVNLKKWGTAPLRSLIDRSNVRVVVHYNHPYRNEAVVTNYRLVKRNGYVPRIAVDSITKGASCPFGDIIILRGYGVEGDVIITSRPIEHIEQKYFCMLDNFPVTKDGEVIEKYRLSGIKIPESLYKFGQAVYVYRLTEKVGIYDDDDADSDNTIVGVRIYPYGLDVDVFGVFRPVYKGGYWKVIYPSQPGEPAEKEWISAPAMTPEQAKEGQIYFSARRGYVRAEKAMGWSGWCWLSAWPAEAEKASIQEIEAL